MIGAGPTLASVARGRILPCPPACVHPTMTHFRTISHSLRIRFILADCKPLTPVRAFRHDGQNFLKNMLSGVDFRKVIPRPPA